MTLFGMEHYEVIVLSWLLAATALGVVTAVTFTLVFGVFGKMGRVAAPSAGRAAPAQPRREPSVARTPVGAM